MGTNITFTGIYFNSGSEPSNGHMLFGDRSTIRIQYHNDISKGTTTGAHLRVGRTPSGANCLSADICAQVDIRSANGVQPPPGGGWGPNPTWPGMLAIDALGDVRCRRIIELRCGALRNDYDIVKIAPGSTATNDKISIFDARDDANFGRARKIAGGALVLA
jgi:hypothetical protein